MAQTYDAYSNPHKITTTPDYSIADAKALLKQTIHDNWQEVGYSADPSSSSISYNNKVVTVNGADCYVFSCSGKTLLWLLSCLLCTMHIMASTSR